MLAFDEPTLIDLLAGRVSRIRMHIRQLPIPPKLVRDDYENDAQFRERFQIWISGLWVEKDALISQVRASK